MCLGEETIGRTSIPYGPPGQRLNCYTFIYFYVINVRTALYTSEILDNLLIRLRLRTGLVNCFNERWRCRTVVMFTRYPPHG